MEFLRRRVVVRDVHTERYGRTYAGREGRIQGFSRDPETTEPTEFSVYLGAGEDPAGTPFEPHEVEFLD